MSSTYIPHHDNIHNNDSQFQYHPFSIDKIYSAYDEIKYIKKGCTYCSSGVFNLVQENTHGIRNIRFHNIGCVKNIKIYINNYIVWQYNNDTRDSYVFVDIWKDYHVLPLFAISKTIPIINITLFDDLQKSPPIYASYDVVFGIGNKNILLNAPKIQLFHKLADNKYLTYFNNVCEMNNSCGVGYFSSDREIFTVDKNMVNVSIIIYQPHDCKDCELYSTQKIDDKQVSKHQLNEFIHTTQCMHQYCTINITPIFQYNKNQSIKARENDIQTFKKFIQFLKSKKQPPDDQLTHSNDTTICEMVNKYNTNCDDMYDLS